MLFILGYDCFDGFWLFVVVYDGLWLFVVVYDGYGCLWLFMMVMVVYGCLWLFVVVYGCLFAIRGSVRGRSELCVNRIFSTRSVLKIKTLRLGAKTLF